MIFLNMKNVVKELHKENWKYKEKPSRFTKDVTMSYLFLEKKDTVIDKVIL